MKPGNLLIQGAKSGGKRKMRIRLSAHRIFGVRFLFYSIERKCKQWKKDCLPLNA